MRRQEGKVREQVGGLLESGKKGVQRFRIYGLRFIFRFWDLGGGFRLSFCLGLGLKFMVAASAFYGSGRFSDLYKYAVRFLPPLAVPFIPLLITIFSDVVTKLTPYAFPTNPRFWNYENLGLGFGFSGLGYMEKIILGP